MTEFTNILDVIESSDPGGCGVSHGQFEVATMFTDLNWLNLAEARNQNAASD